MEKLKRISPHSLEGDQGWQMRDQYNDCMKILEEYEAKATVEWQNNITSEIRMKLKQPLLVRSLMEYEVKVMVVWQNNIMSEIRMKLKQPLLVRS